jgi:hypothetical protein
MIIQRRAIAFLPLALLLAPGCAKYQYLLQDPAIPSGVAAAPIVVAANDDVLHELTPITYRLRTVEGRLVIRALNSSDQPLRLLGAKSAIVDPTGQARPIPPQALPPGAFLKLILPPIRPAFIANAGPSRSYAGPGLSRREFGFDDDASPPTRYEYRDAGQTYWDWQGETTVTLTLTYARPDNSEFTHTLLLSRRRAD